MNVFQIAFILVALGLYYAFSFSTRSAAVEAVVRLQRIRYVARLFKWLCCAAFGFVIFMGVIAIARPEMVGTKADLAGSIKSASGPVVTISGPIVLRDFKADYRWLYSIFWVLLAAFILRGIGFFYHLFCNLENGQLFCPDNVRCIRNIGLWVVLAPLLGVAFELSKAVWAQVGIPVMIDASPVLDGFVKGFFVIFIAWIMDEGRKIQEEQDLTV